MLAIRIRQLPHIFLVPVITMNLIAGDLFAQLFVIIGNGVC